MYSERTGPLKNVMVIGETGVGKSSLINLICQRNVAAASSSATGCTLEITKYYFDDFCLIDTVGYNDVSEKNMTQSLKNLANFAMNTSDEGISLILYVMKKGRVNAASKVNYDYFVKKFCEDKVPVLLVVTHCESDSSESNWHADTQQQFRELEMNFSYTVCGSTMALPNKLIDKDLIPFFTKKVAKTREEVLKQMHQLSLVPPWKPGNFGEWVVKILLASVVFGISVAAVAATVPMFGAVVTAAGAALLSKAQQRF